MTQFLRIYFNYALFILGVRDVLPRDVINKVVSKENYEPLTVLSGEGIFTGGEVRVRVSVAEKLKSAARCLQQEGYGLFVYEGHRSNEKQRAQWDDAVGRARASNLEMSDREIEALVQKQIARPDGIGGGHQTGGAVDLTLCSPDGNPLFMGTEYLEFNELTRTNVYLEDKDAHTRRKALRSAMHEVSFVNYPNEWWHYSYGDRMWAAYSLKKTCPYDVL